MIKMKVMIPTTPAAIQDHDHNGEVVSLTLESPFSKPRPETSAQPLRKKVSGAIKRAKARVRCLFL
jgi:hypothetical protein